MATDNELLSEFAFEGSEGAFSSLVRHHIDLVYFAALREMAGDSSLAEEVAEAVFRDLALNASVLCGHPALASWLYTRVREIEGDFGRAGKRSNVRERSADEVNKLSPRSGVDPSPWPEIGLVLDDAVRELDEKERTAVILRLFEQRTIDDVGAALHLTTAGVHGCIDRALEELCLLLGKRGVQSTTSALAAAFSVGATMAAPRGLTNRITANVMDRCLGFSSHLYRFPTVNRGLSAPVPKSVRGKPREQRITDRTMQHPLAGRGNMRATPVRLK